MKITQHSEPIICAPWSSIWTSFPAELIRYDLTIGSFTIPLHQYMRYSEDGQVKTDHFFIPDSWVYPLHES